MLVKAYQRQLSASSRTIIGLCLGSRSLLCLPGGNFMPSPEFEIHLEADGFRIQISLHAWHLPWALGDSDSTPGCRKGNSGWLVQIEFLSSCYPRTLAIFPMSQMIALPTRNSNQNLLIMSDSIFPSLSHPILAPLPPKYIAQVCSFHLPCHCSRPIQYHLSLGCPKSLSFSGLPL